MELLKRRILQDGKVKDGGVLKVDSFLNHRMDITLLQEIGKEFRRRFPQKEIVDVFIKYQKSVYPFWIHAFSLKSGSIAQVSQGFRGGKSPL